MILPDFLVYALPNAEVKSFIGTWHKVVDEKPSGFIVSDAHGEQFWQFVPDIELDLGEILVPILKNQEAAELSISEYVTNCSALIQEMREKNIEKVVFSRVKIKTRPMDNFKPIFKQLREHYPNNLNYVFYSQELGFWMGSTPEILVQSQGENYTSMALAGTLGATESDEAWTQKEKDEQQYVSDYLVALIGKYGEVTQKSERYVHQVGPVKHLRNDFEFSMDDSNLWQFIRDFHPTPAVCGVPKNAARDLYQKYETHQRELYTGIIGWVEPSNMHLFVNLRCMKVYNNAAALYVGGGLTEESDPYKEWLETERKSEALGRFLG